MSVSYAELAGGGRWEWDDEECTVKFVRNQSDKKKRGDGGRAYGRRKRGMRKLREGLELVFVDTQDPTEMARFRRFFARRVRPAHLHTDVVLVQDVLDVVLFQCRTPLSTDFICMLHSQACSRFFRACIVYFQLFLQAVEWIQERRETRAQKLNEGHLTESEQQMQLDLADLRALVSRQYCYLLVGGGDFGPFHHKGASGESLSITSERDIRLFEMLYRIAGRVVYVAMQRKHQTVIELEINRLVRSQVFNIAAHKRERAQAALGAGKVEGMGVKQMRLAAAQGGKEAAVSLAYQGHEAVILYGTGPGGVGHKMYRVSKYKKLSPATYEVIGDDVDYRLMAVGDLDFGNRDDRLSCLWNLISLPEEQLTAKGLVVGIVGQLRMNFDPMLFPLLRTSVVPLSVVTAAPGDAGTVPRPSEVTDESQFSSVTAEEEEEEKEEVKEEEEGEKTLNLPRRPPDAEVPPPPLHFPQRDDSTDPHAVERRKALQRWRKRQRAMKEKHGLGAATGPVFEASLVTVAFGRQLIKEILEEVPALAEARAAEAALSVAGDTVQAVVDSVGKRSLASFASVASSASAASAVSALFAAAASHPPSISAAKMAMADPGAAAAQVIAAAEALAAGQVEGFEVLKRAEEIIEEKERSVTETEGAMPEKEEPPADEEPAEGEEPEEEEEPTPKEE